MDIEKTRDLIKRAMKLKNELLDGEIYVDADFDDIDRWGKNRLASAISVKKGLIGDSEICFHCNAHKTIGAIKFEDCKVCPYGKRHGICIGDEPNSTYKIIINKIRETPIYSTIHGHLLSLARAGDERAIEFYKIVSELTEIDFSHEFE